MNLLSTYRTWRNYRVAVDELSRLSNRSLADIGMKRGDSQGGPQRGLTTGISFRSILLPDCEECSRSLPPPMTG